MTKTPYDTWLAQRREIRPAAALADQIMGEVLELNRQCRDDWRLRLVQRIEQSRLVRLAVCGGALVVGSLPFVFLGRVAQLAAF